MSDRHLFDLAPGWALGYDERQFMVMKGRQKNGTQIWRPVSFVASTKLVLARVISEHGIVPTPAAQKALDQLPERFREWINQQQSKTNNVVVVANEKAAPATNGIRPPVKVSVV
jgi:hypothetical protein